MLIKTFPRKPLHFLDLEKSDNGFVEMATNIEIREKAINEKVLSKNLFCGICPFLALASYFTLH